MYMAPTGLIRLALFTFATLAIASCSPAKRAESPESAAAPVAAANEPIPNAGAMLTFRPGGVNDSSLRTRPYVILVSIDGYRHDYNKVFNAPNLSAIAEEGVAAESMRPVYPSKTFPNHYSLVTGLSADRHGIVSNEFYDPARDAVYSLPDRKSVEDGSWYFGEPIWETLARQGMRSASYFWVGSDANINGFHPNYYFRYDESVPNEARVDQVVKWLKLPEEKRPHLVLLYFSDVDTAAHRHGIDAPETRAAVAKIDAAIGKLRKGIKETGLPVNLIIVSDHGMEDVDPSKVILLDDTIRKTQVLAKFRAVGRGPQIQLYLNRGEDPKWIWELRYLLRPDAKNYRILLGDGMRKLKYGPSRRVGDIVIEPDAPYLVGFKSNPPAAKGANHGWDGQKFKSMHGVFLAVGPGFQEKTKLPTVDNVQVYPLILELLGLKAPKEIDGRIDQLRAGLKKTAPGAVPKPRDRAKTPQDPKQGATCAQTRFVVS